MPDATSLRIVFLGSGSRGNATVVTDGTTTVLIDAGFSAKEIARRMGMAGLDAASVSALFVTHEHSDHVRGVDVFSRRRRCAVFASPGTCRAAGLHALEAEVRPMGPGESVSVGSLTVTPFRTSHDAAQPVGYLVVSDAGERFGMVTDTGVLTPEAAEALAGVDYLGVESNHDLAMLDAGPYPHFLKVRIRSERGHLSNACAADALERLASERLRRVFALHRSDTNNLPRLAQRALVSRAERIGLSVAVDVAPQDRVLDSRPAQGEFFGGDGDAR